MKTKIGPEKTFRTRAWYKTLLGCKYLLRPILTVKKKEEKLDRLYYGTTSEMELFCISTRDHFFQRWEPKKLGTQFRTTPNADKAGWLCVVFKILQQL